MITKADQAGSISIKKGDVIFMEGHEVQTLNILLQGKIDVYISSKNNTRTGNALNKSYKIFSIDKNIFFGANDIILNTRHSFSFLASEDCNLYLYPAATPGQAWALVNSQKDYGTYLVNSLNTMITSASRTLEKIKATESLLKSICDNLVTWFWVLKEAYRLDFTPSSTYFRNGLDRLQSLHEKDIKPAPVFSRQFIEEDHEKNTSEEDASFPESQLKIEYFQHLCNLPSELQKSFFASDMLITSYHCREEAECLEAVISTLRDTFASVEAHYRSLYSDSPECIYNVYQTAVKDMAKSGLDCTPALQALEYITSTVKEIVARYSQDYLHQCETDIPYLEHSYNSIKTATDMPAGITTAGTRGRNTAEADFSSLPEELKDSAAKILEYSELPPERTDLFMMNLIAFRNMRDRLSIDDEARHIRSSAASVFFDIYAAVFKKAAQKADNSRLINMFLNYGFMDEKLLTPQQSLEIYKIAGKTFPQGHQPVYCMRDWMSGIYSMSKEPSINEFGQDYFDVFREMKKRGQVSDRDKNVYDNNADARLSYEIHNMFRTNHKLCHGQISVYFPVLHKEMLVRDPGKVQVTPDKVQKSLDKILEVDFSAFYREIHYVDQNKAIEKELIMKSIRPEIILVPVYGSRAVMWQEITGRNRNTPARFLLPAFMDEDLDSILLRLVGNFRWELCRTMMGSAWNDVTESSLTSEYTDYIQFYKKNKELSEEAKEKIKAQTAKYHGRMRDIFTSDYEIWINNESKGNVRLNKVARSILYRHCPFSKAIREQMEKQPMYSDIAAQFRNQRAKTARDLENRYNRYIKSNLSIGPELEHNLAFYRDM